MTCQRWIWPVVRQFEERVHEIWRIKKDPDNMTLKEEEKVYRFFYITMVDADETALRYYIDRYHHAAVLNNWWLLELLSNYPTDGNYGIFERIYPQSTHAYKSVLRQLISLPRISCDALELVLRKLAVIVGKKSLRKIRSLAKKRLKNRQLDAFAYEI